MNKYKVGKTFSLFVIVMGLMMQAGCSMVVSGEGLHALHEKVVQVELKKEVDMPSGDLTEEKTPAVQISNQMKEALEHGKRILDKNGNTAALIRRIEGVTGFEKVRDGKMIYLNYGNVAAEYFAAEETDPSEYFDVYADKEKYLTSAYSDFHTSGRKTITVDALSLESSDIKKMQGAGMPAHPEKKESIGTWEMYTYLTGGQKYTEYFCAIPFNNLDGEGVLSVHMRFLVNRNDPENFKDPVFLKAADAVIPVIPEEMY